MAIKSRREDPVAYEERVERLEKKATELGTIPFMTIEYEEYRTPSTSVPDLLYVLSRNDKAGGFTCSCEGYYHTGLCYHLAALGLRARRENWSELFEIAERSRVFLPEPGSSESERRR